MSTHQFHQPWIRAWRAWLTFAVFASLATTSCDCRRGARSHEAAVAQSLYEAFSDIVRVKPRRRVGADAHDATRELFGRTRFVAMDDGVVVLDEEPGEEGPSLWWIDDRGTSTRLWVSTQMSAVRHFAAVRVDDTRIMAYVSDSERHAIVSSDLTADGARAILDEPVSQNRFGRASMSITPSGDVFISAPSEEKRLDPWRSNAMVVDASTGQVLRLGDGLPATADGKFLHLPFQNIPNTRRWVALDSDGRLLARDLDDAAATWAPVLPERTCKRGETLPEVAVLGRGLVIELTCDEVGALRVVTDGTPSGTVPLIEWFEGATQVSMLGEEAGLEHATAVLVTESPAGRTAWFSDGTREGTRALADLGEAALTFIERRGDTVFASSLRDGRIAQLWSIDTRTGLLGRTPTLLLNGALELWTTQMTRHGVLYARDAARLVFQRWDGVTYELGRGADKVLGATIAFEDRIVFQHFGDDGMLRVSALDQITGARSRILDVAEVNEAGTNTWGLSAGPPQEHGKLRLSIGGLVASLVTDGTREGTYLWPNFEHEFITWLDDGTPLFFVAGKEDDDVSRFVRLETLRRDTVPAYPEYRFVGRLFREEVSQSSTRAVFTAPRPGFGTQLWSLSLETGALSPLLVSTRRRTAVDDPEVIGTIGARVVLSHANKTLSVIDLEDGERDVLVEPCDDARGFWFPLSSLEDGDEASSMVLGRACELGEDELEVELWFTEGTRRSTERVTSKNSCEEERSSYHGLGHDPNEVFVLDDSCTGGHGARRVLAVSREDGDLRTIERGTFELGLPSRSVQGRSGVFVKLAEGSVGGARVTEARLSGGGLEPLFPGVLVHALVVDSGYVLMLGERDGEPFVRYAREEEELSWKTVGGLSCSTFQPLPIGDAQWMFYETCGGSLEPEVPNGWALHRLDAKTGELLTDWFDPELSLLMLSFTPPFVLSTIEARTLVLVDLDSGEERALATAEEGSTIRLNTLSREWDRVAWSIQGEGRPTSLEYASLGERGADVRRVELPAELGDPARSFIHWCAFSRGWLAYQRPQGAPPYLVDAERGEWALLDPGGVKTMGRPCDDAQDGPLIVDHLASGQEPWAFDGSLEGTQLLVDIYPGVTSSFPVNLGVFGAYAYFTAAAPDGGRELWFTDKTSQGTRQVADFWPGPKSSNPRILAHVGDKLLVAADGPEEDGVLWVLETK